MKEHTRQEVLEHLANIKADVSEISADIKAINAQLVAVQQREEFRRHQKQDG